MRDKYNIIPVIMAALLHVLFAVSLLAVFDFSRPVTAAQPLAIEATLVSADDLAAAPPPEYREPEPLPAVEEPAPEPEEPEPEEPEPPQPDPAELQRQEAEERLRQEELAREQQRIRDEEEAERKLKAREAEEKRKREEAELERKRVEAEKKRQEEIERQRKENERKRREALAAEAEAQRLAEIEAEERLLAAMNSGAMARYSYALQQKIERNWVRPASAQVGIECVIDVRQLPGGDVVSATVGRCNGDAAVRRTIEAAVFKASPLPQPEDPNLFQRDLRITFKPEE